MFCPAGLVLPKTLNEFNEQYLPTGSNIKTASPGPIPFYNDYIPNASIPTCPSGTSLFNAFIPSNSSTTGGIAYMTCSTDSKSALQNIVNIDPSKYISVFSSGLCETGQAITATSYYYSGGQSKNVVVPVVISSYSHGQWYHI